MARNRFTTADVPYAHYGDMAGHGDVRNPLHHKPLPHRSGSHAEKVVVRGIEDPSESLYMKDGDMVGGDGC